MDFYGVGIEFVDDEIDWVYVLKVYIDEGLVGVNFEEDELLGKW